MFTDVPDSSVLLFFCRHFGLYQSALLVGKPFISLYGTPGGLGTSIPSAVAASPTRGVIRTRQLLGQRMAYDTMLVKRGRVSLIRFRPALIFGLDVL